MNRRELLTGAAVLAGVTQANALGISKEGLLFSRMGAVRGRAGRATWSANPGVSTFCDSWSAQQYADANQLIKSTQHPFTWWAGLSAQTPQWINNTGISGQRSDQWFPRLPAILADASKWVYVT